MLAIKNQIYVLFLILILGWNTGNLNAQASNQKLTDFWEIGQELVYEVDTWGRSLGSSQTAFIGAVKHSVVGKAYLFKTETTTHRLNGEISIQINSEMFTDSKGLPRFYDVEYYEKAKTTAYQGFLNKYEFEFRGAGDNPDSGFTVNMSPATVLCDRQSVGQWNLAFYNCTDLEADTIVFNVLIPYLKTRAKMSMARQADEQLTVMGKQILCKVFLSLRTNEIYYITPEKLVARIYLPDQGLSYTLSSIDMAVQPANKKEK